MGWLYGLGALLGIPAGAWMIRIMPLLFGWIGIYVLYQELRHRSERLARWALLLAALHPMISVYTRVSISHAFLVGAFAMLVAEASRVARTGEMRWLRLGVLCGFSVEAHSTAFAGIFFTFLPVLPSVYQNIRRKPAQAVTAIALALALAWSVLRNFPPPVSTAAERSGSLALEIRNFLNMIIGHLPLRFQFHDDPAPAALLVSFLAILGWTFFRQLRTLHRSSEANDVFLRRLWFSYAAGSLALAVMCFRGRTLTMVGHERYFLALTPGWILLWADAFSRFRRERLVAGALWLFFFLRLAVPAGREALDTDPALTASRWLERECPREKCVAYAQNFWNYWPIRYYTRDSIDLNIVEPTWKQVPYFARNGREAAGCWLFDSVEELRKDPRVYGGAARESVRFMPQAAVWGEACFSGIAGAFRR
jgi:hypothetical protein